MLEVEQLGIRYGGQVAVNDLSLVVQPGQVVALVGANGAGKTSALSAISGLVRPSAGVVRLNGVDITGRKPFAVVRMGISHVPEGRRIIAPLTVEENLLLGAYGRRKQRDAVQQTLADVYERFPILQERKTGRAGLLSGGEQQMLAFGRALMADPSVILLDEPTMGLAPVVGQSVLSAIDGMRARGLAVLMVEQNGAAVTEVADYIYLLERGFVVGHGSAKDMAGDEIMRALLGLTGAGGLDAGVAESSGIARG